MAHHSVATTRNGVAGCALYRTAVSILTSGIVSMCACVMLHITILPLSLNTILSYLPKQRRTVSPHTHLHTHTHTHTCTHTHTHTPAHTPAHTPCWPCPPYTCPNPTSGSVLCHTECRGAGSDESRPQKPSDHHCQREAAGNC